MRAALLVVLAALCATSAAREPTPAGLWKTFSDRTGQADGFVRIVEVNGIFEGTVEKVLSPPAPDPNPRCEECRGELKNRPVVGLKILRGLRREGDGYSGGEILDPDDGSVYRCRLRLLEGGRKLEVRGYIGIELLGRTQVWERED
jgi:uncharacterized protein (DUF2147 family)